VRKESLADLDIACAQTRKAPGRLAKELWDDVGGAINPLILHGSDVWRNCLRRRPSAPREQLLRASEGQLLAASFMDYGMPRADTLPLFGDSAQ
jgi:aerobic carbon-monoxide dehydrogenase large subunit